MKARVGVYDIDVTAIYRGEGETPERDATKAFVLLMATFCKVAANEFKAQGYAAFEKLSNEYAKGFEEAALR